MTVDPNLETELSEIKPEPTSLSPDRRLLTEATAKDIYMSKERVYTLFGVAIAVLLGAISVLFNIARDGARSAAMEPIPEIRATAEKAMEKATKVETELGTKYVELKSEIQGVRTEMADTRKAVAESEKSIAGKIDNLTSNFNTYITTQASKGK